MDNKKCPITGNNCDNFKHFQVTNIKNKSLNSINICEDCLVELNSNSHICDFCGLTLEELVKNLKMGCQNCYYKFEKFLLLGLEKFQKNPDSTVELKHTGRIPHSWKKQQIENLDPKKFLLELKQKLALSVKKENYDKASDLKNKIFAFENFIRKIEENKSDFEQVALIKKQICDFIFSFREEDLKEK